MSPLKLVADTLCTLVLVQSVRMLLGAELLEDFVVMLVVAVTEEAELIWLLEGQFVQLVSVDNTWL